MSNTANFRGNLVSDPNIRGEFVEVTIAHNPVGKAAERYAPIFLRATMKTDSIWGKMAAECKKGDKAYVEGQMQLREYEGKNGKGVSLEIPFVSSFEKMGKVPGPETQPETNSDPFGL